MNGNVESTREDDKTGKKRLSSHLDWNSRGRTVQDTICMNVMQTDLGNVDAN